MSIQTIQSKVNRTRQQVNSLQQKLTDETKEESTKRKRILQIKQSIARTTSASTFQSKLREIERLEREITHSQGCPRPAQMNQLDEGVRDSSKRRDWVFSMG